jgi:hypothetical protein
MKPQGTLIIKSSYRVAACGVLGLRPRALHARSGRIEINGPRVSLVVEAGPRQAWVSGLPNSEIVARSGILDGLETIAAHLFRGIADGRRGRWGSRGLRNETRAHNQCA